MALETKLYQKLSQQLVMTPQLRQAIKILQVSRAELETLIQEELAENPILEEGQEQIEEEPASRTDESVRDEAPAQDEWLDPGRETEKTDEIEPNADKLAEIDWREYLNTYSDEPAKVVVEITFGELQSKGVHQLHKGAAIVRYSEALRLWNEAPGAPEAYVSAAEAALGRVSLAELKHPQDPSLAEIQAVLKVLLESLQ